MSRQHLVALPLFVAFLFASIVLSAPNARTASATTEAPVPTYLPFFKVVGFAGAMNYKFNLMVSEDVDASHSLILTAMSFRESDFMSSTYSRQNRVVIKATYPTKDSGEVTVTSDTYGYVEISNIAVGQSIAVEVLREMDSGYDVPFRFYSMQANVDHRYITLQPQETFRMPIPYNLRSGKAYSLTFKAVPPYDDGEIGFRVDTGFGLSNAAMKVTSCATGSTAAEDLKPNTVIGWNGQSPAYVTLTPKSYMLDMTMDWQEKPSGVSLSPAAVCTAPAGSTNPAGGSPDGSASNGGGSQGTTPGGTVHTTSTAAPHTSITANGFSVILIIFLVTVTYFSIAILINVKMRGITTYPEMVPHINEMRAAREYFGNLSQSMRSGGRAGYSEVDRRGEADISNY